MKNTQFPTDPDQYVHTNHYRDVLSYDTRFLTESLVEKTIRNGEDSIRSAADARIRRRKTFDGIEVVVVLGESVDGPPAIVTAWTEIDLIVDALQSDMWTREQIEVIQDFDIQQDTQPTL